MRDWYRLNETRESWVFLLLDDDEESKLRQWAFGVGNISHLVRTAERSSSEVRNETALIDSLREDLQIDQHNTPLLITPDADTLAFLRQRLIAHQTEAQSSLRGFRHAAVQDVIDAHFGSEIPRGSLGQSLGSRLDGDTVAGSSSTTDVTALWELWTDIVPYVPAEALRGVPL